MDKDLAEQYLNIAGVIIVALDKSANIIFLNKKAENILRCSLKDFEGKSWIDNFIPADEREKMEAVQKEVSGNRAYPEYFENYIIDKGGERHLIAWHNSTLFGEGGIILGSISSGEDITGKREIEENFKKHSEELERINKFMIGRENKMTELKERINELEKELEIHRSSASE